MWQHSGDSRWIDLAVQAGVAVRRSRWYAGTCQCHGLAGDGEFLLDLAEATENRRYRDWAEELIVSLHARRVIRDGRVLVPDETASAVVADYNTGLAGVLAFLLRFSGGGPRLWLPGSARDNGTAAPPG
jgi:hypothetical protein